MIYSNYIFAKVREKIRRNECFIADKNMCAENKDFSMNRKRSNILKVIKKDGTLEEYDEQKIINACNKAARRAMIELSENDYQCICDGVWEKLVENDLEDTEIYDMHNIVESVLDDLFPEVAKKYREYRNYKKDFGVFHI